MDATARINLRDVNRGIRGMRRQVDGAQSRAFFSALRKPVKEDVAEHQKERRGEAGAWPALDPDTLDKRRRRRASAAGRRKRRRRRAVSTARMLGRLPRAWQVLVSPDSIRLVNRVRWSDVHNTGGQAGNGARIPQRQFAYVSADLVQGAQELYQRHVMQGWTRG